MSKYTTSTGSRRIRSDSGADPGGMQGKACFDRPDEAGQPHSRPLPV